MARAAWNHVVLAETDHPVLPEGDVYFPPRGLRREHLARLAFWNGVRVELAAGPQDQASVAG